jgi:Helix-turn-helix domain
MADKLDRMLAKLDRIEKLLLTDDLVGSYLKLVVARQFEEIKATLQTLVKGQAREWYTVEEFASVTSKAPFTVREWCRLGRIKGTKQKSGRGAYAAWVISHAELVRFQRDGLLPFKTGKGRP